MGDNAKKGLAEFTDKINQDRKDFIIWFCKHFCAGQYKGYTGEDFLWSVDCVYRGQLKNTHTHTNNLIK